MVYAGDTYVAETLIDVNDAVTELARCTCFVVSCVNYLSLYGHSFPRSPRFAPLYRKRPAS